MKKAQVNQVFIAIFAVIVIALIILTGLRFIQSAQQKTQNAELLEFEKAMQNTVDENLHGQVSVEKIKVPSGYNLICMADTSKSSEIVKSKAIDAYPKMKDSISSGTKNNVFMITKDSDYEFFAGDITIDHYPYYYCYTQEIGYIQLNLEGKGSSSLLNNEFKTEVEASPSESVELTSIDGKAVLKIPAGTKVTPEQRLFVEPVINPKTSGTFVVASEVYDFGPDGITFDPAATLQIKYDPKLILIDESKMKIVYYDGQSWQSLESIVDVTNKIITAKVTHFTEFAAAYDVAEKPLLQKEKGMNWWIIIAAILLALAILIWLRKRKV